MKALNKKRLNEIHEEQTQITSNVFDRVPHIPSLAISHGDKVCCHLCGRQNWPIINDVHPEFDINKTFLLVSTDFVQQPTRENSMILCPDCLKKAIQNRFNTDSFALMNEGTCEESLSGSRMVSLNFQQEEDLVGWLKNKHKLDSEIWKIDDSFSVMRWLVELWLSHSLKVQGVDYSSKCHELICRELGITK